MTDFPVKKSRICVLDDDPDVLQSLRFLLETYGFGVRTFSAATVLLGSIDPDDVDCLVIDYKMPHMDGLDVAARLRQRKIATPIVLMTDYSDPHIAGRAATIGIDYILLKPHLEDSLVTRIRDAISRE